MGFDPKVRSEELLSNEDRRWLGTRDGTNNQRSITLDPALFTDAHLINGSLRSGLVLAKVEATALYGPYAGSPSEVQTITVDATGGTFTVTFDGQTTGAIAFNATAAAVQTALEAIGNINPGDVTVSGGPGNAGGTTPYSIAFGGRYMGQNVPAVTTTPTLTGGAATAAVGTAGAGGGATPGGLGRARGHLYSSLPFVTGAAGTKVGVALWWQGVCIEQFLPVPAATSGRLDPAARAELGNFIKYEAA